MMNMSGHGIIRRCEAILLALLLVAPVGLDAQNGGVSLALGTPGPTAELEDLDGNTVSLLDLSLIHI